MQSGFSGQGASLEKDAYIRIESSWLCFSPSLGYAHLQTKQEVSTGMLKGEATWWYL